MAHLRELSGKAIRLGARYISVVGMGGSLLDTAEQFFERLKTQTGWETPKLQELYEQRKKEAEEKIMKEPGFFERHKDIFSFVRKKIGAQFYKGKGEEVRVMFTRRVSDLADKEKGSRIRKLLAELKASKDQTDKRRIRSRLRRLGHTGGSKVKRK